MMNIDKAKENFAKMLESCYSVGTVETFANGIRALVASGETSWNELGFSDKDVAQRLRKKAA